MEKDKNSSKLLDSISPMSILDALAESIIDLVRPAAIARLQEHNPSNKNLIVMHEPIEIGIGSGSLSVHSGVDFCQITVILNPTLPKPHPSGLPQLRRRYCLRRGPVNIFMSPQSIEITRHEISRKIPSGVCTGSSLSWIRSSFDSDPNLLPWKRGSLDVLPIIVERLNAWIRGFEELFRLATEYKSHSKVPQILGVIHILKQMIRVLSPGVEKKGGRKGMDKRKRCSVELFASENSDIIPHKSMRSRYGSDDFSMEEVVEDIGGARGVMEDPEEYSEVVNKMQKLCCHGRKIYCHETLRIV